MNVQVHKLDRSEALQVYMKPEHCADLNRRSYGLWKLFTSDAKYLALKERYELEAMAEYEAALHRYYVAYWTAMSGVSSRRVDVDYRVKFPGHAGLVRATDDMYRHAVEMGYPNRIGPVPKPQPELVAA